MFKQFNSIWIRIVVVEEIVRDVTGFPRRHGVASSFPGSTQPFPAEEKRITPHFGFFPR